MTEALQIPIMCTLSEAALQERKTYLQKSLFDGLQAVEPTDKGYRLLFPATAVYLEQVTQFIKVERDCCAFLSFELALPAQQETMQLHIFGAEGVKTFLEQELLG